MPPPSLPPPPPPRLSATREVEVIARPENYLNIDEWIPDTLRQQLSDCFLQTLVEIPELNQPLTDDQLMPYLPRL